MTKSDFLFLCNEVSVMPEIALENQFVRPVLEQDHTQHKVRHDIKPVDMVKTTF